MKLNQCRDQFTMSTLLTVICFVVTFISQIQCQLNVIPDPQYDVAFPSGYGLPGMYRHHWRLTGAFFKAISTRIITLPKQCAC